MDVSADLTELGRTPVTVVCAGVKTVLDIPRTLEYLETQVLVGFLTCPLHDFLHTCLPRGIPPLFQSPFFHELPSHLHTAGVCTIVYDILASYCSAARMHFSLSPSLNSSLMARMSASAYFLVDMVSCAPLCARLEDKLQTAGAVLGNGTITCSVNVS